MDMCPDGCGRHAFVYTRRILLSVVYMYRRNVLDLFKVVMALFIIIKSGKGEKV